MLRRFLHLLWALFAPGLAIEASAQTVVDPNLTVTRLLPIGSLALPTQIRFLALRDFLVTEKDTGRIMRVQNGTLLPTPALDLAVSPDGERGLLGFTLDPAFSTNHFAYVYYSAVSGTADGDPWLENRLSRFVWNGTSFSGEVVLKTFGTATDGQSAGPSHNAGPIVFGPDQLLYGTTGDLNRGGAEQNNLSYPNDSAFVGGIYRLNADGSVPASNPFTASPNPDFHKWFGYGVRNTFGIAFDPLTGRLWETENGPDAYDEINLIEAGFNGGWFAIMGPDSRDPQGLTDLVQLPGSTYSDPEFSFLSPIGITGMAFLANSSFGPTYQDALLVGDSNYGFLYLLRLNPARDGFVLSGGLADLVADNPTERDAVRFGQDFSVITDIQIGPDGAAYVTSLGYGTIYRIVPEPSSLAMMLVGSIAVIALRYRRRL